MGRPGRGTASPEAQPVAIRSRIFSRLDAVMPMFRLRQGSKLLPIDVLLYGFQEAVSFPTSAALADVQTIVLSHQ
jgi:hypothetical protein